MTTTVTQERAYDKSAADLKVKIFADGADRDSMLESYANPLVSGFTTNPTLMRRAGVTDYRAFAQEIVKEIPDRDISFEVFSDEFEDMERQAREIATWGENVYVKIPISNTKGESSCDMINRLSQDGVKVNVTAIFLLNQVREVAAAVDGGAPCCVWTLCSASGSSSRIRRCWSASCILSRSSAAGPLSSVSSSVPISF